ncbi:carbohydrate ABC transporter permease [Psychromicrobium xiongbiense]|uniref:carbohydrate ABC transporter permease n=1 Tax=Psychromicrobium xiongbiense TaxID=3051184 RepID=UPI0025550996|nr:carbohydrate ABC transporter permease [Psychromicrobium sp. YIM S02556]
MEKPHPVTLALKVLLIALICFLTLYPMLAVLGTSLSSQPEIAANNGFVLIPMKPTLEAYQTIFSGGVVTSALVRSLLITVIGTLASLAVTVGMAYGLTRRDLVGGRFFLTAALFTMLFSAGIIPNFLMIKQLGLLNNYAALILPVLLSAFNLIVIRSFFQSLPQELLEAARLDGLGDFGILVKVVLPLSKAVLAVIGLFYAVGYWNAFFNAMLYLNSDQWPLPMILRQYALLGQPLADSTNTSEITAPTQAIQMAVVVISLVPIAAAFPFLQRYFTKGVLTGAVKG